MLQEVETKKGCTEYPWVKVELYRRCRATEIGPVMLTLPRRLTLSRNHLYLIPLPTASTTANAVQGTGGTFSVRINGQQDGGKIEKRKMEMNIGG